MSVPEDINDCCRADLICFSDRLVEDIELFFIPLNSEVF